MRSNTVAAPEVVLAAVMGRPKLNVRAAPGVATVIATAVVLEVVVVEAGVTAANSVTVVGVEVAVLQPGTVAAVLATIVAAAAVVVVVTAAVAVAEEVGRSPVPFITVWRLGDATCEFTKNKKG